MDERLFTLDDLADDLDVFADPGEGLIKGLSMPSLDDLRARGAEAEHEAPARKRVHRHRRHRGVRGRATRDLHDAGAGADLFGMRAEPSEGAHGVRAPSLSRPD